MKIRIVLLLSIALPLSASPHGNNKAGDSTIADQAIGEVVVTGQYASGTVEKAVQRIRVIDRKKIDAMSAQNLRDVLMNEMNIRLSQDNVLGSSLSVQGITGQNVKILVDGVPVIGRQDGNIDLTQINLHNIERIEVIEGPMSVNYGTDALAGTINLITRKTTTHSWEAGIASYAENIGNYNLNGRLAFRRGRHSVSLTGGRNLFDGWKQDDPILVGFGAAPADRNRTQDWKPKTQYLAGLQYALKVNAATIITYKGDYFRETILNRGTPDYYGEKALDDYYRTYRSDHALYLNSTLKKHHNLHVQVAFNDYKRVKNTYNKDLTTLSEALSQADGAQDTSRFRLFSSRGTFSAARPEAKINYEIGYDVNVETATGVRIEEGRQAIGDYAVFASAEYRPLTSLTIRPGLRYAYNTDYPAPLVPSVHVRYKLESVTLRASWARGFRSPTLKELYFDFHDSNHDIDGNKDLRAEYSDNYNVAAQYAARSGRVGYRLEATAFYNDIRDRIDLAAVSGSRYSYVNIGRYRSRGIQFNADLNIDRFHATAGFSYLGRLNALSGESNIPEYSYNPEARASATYDIRPLDLSASVFFKYTGRTPGYGLNDSGAVVRTSIAAFSMADLTLSRLFFHKQLNIGIGCKNIFDVTRISQTAGTDGTAHGGSGTSIPYSTGRSYFVRADLNLKGK